MGRTNFSLDCFKYSWCSCSWPSFSFFFFSNSSNLDLRSSMIECRLLQIWVFYFRCNYSLFILDFLLLVVGGVVRWLHFLQSILHFFQFSLRCFTKIVKITAFHQISVSLLSLAFLGQINRELLAAFLLTSNSLLQFSNSKHLLLKTIFLPKFGLRLILLSNFLSDHNFRRSFVFSEIVTLNCPDW